MSSKTERNPIVERLRRAVGQPIAVFVRDIYPTDHRDLVPEYAKNYIIAPAEGDYRA